MLSSSRAVARLYYRWEFSRSSLYQGWWMLTSYSMVVDASLDASQLLIIAAVQGIASVIVEVPAGLLADTISRKWSLVVFHGLRAVAMVTAGLFPAFWPLLAANALNGVSWTFSSGADVAWVSDELDDPGRVPVTLVRGGRWALAGAACGMAACGLAAVLWDRTPVMVVTGVLMAVLGVAVAVLFPERHFRPATGNRVKAAGVVAASGLRLIARDSTLLVLLAITMLVNGAFDSFGRVYPLALNEQGLPSDAAGTGYFTVLTLTGLALGSLSLRLVERHVATEQGASHSLALAALSGVLGMALVGSGAHLAFGILGILILGGLATPLTRTVTTVWVNRRAPGAVRATVHSFFGQAEYLGELLTAATLSVIAANGDFRVTSTVTAGLLLLSALLAAGHRRHSRLA